MITVTKINASKSKQAFNGSYGLLIQTNVRTILGTIAKKNNGMKEDSIILTKYIAEVKRDKERRIKVDVNSESKTMNNTSANTISSQPTSNSTTKFCANTSLSHQYRNQPQITKQMDTTIQQNSTNLPLSKNRRNECELIKKRQLFEIDTIINRQETLLAETNITNIAKSTKQMESMTDATTGRVQQVITIDLEGENNQITHKSAERINEEVSTIEEEEMKCKQRINVMNPCSWMKRKQLDLAIVVLRHECTNSNIFIAGSGAVNIIQQWNINQGWFNFARIFASNVAAHRKPDGLYIIPVFSGDTSRGHWHTLAIEKNRSS